MGHWQALITAAVMGPRCRGVWRAGVEGSPCTIILSHDIVYILRVRFSDHFEEDRRDASDRREITLKMCELVKARPLDEDSENQPRGRTAYWGYVAEKARYLKVVVEADGEEVTTAHWDRGFGRKMKRRQEDRQ